MLLTIDTLGEALPGLGVLNDAKAFAERKEGSQQQEKAQGH